ncbi:unnamed protein product [Urochloa humidicola]
MAMRAAAAAAAACLRAAGVSASGCGRGLGCGGGGGGATGLIYGQQAPCFSDVPARVRAGGCGGGPRTFFSFVKGRRNQPTTNRVTEGKINSDQLIPESQNREVLKLKLQLEFEKALGNQRLEYEGKLAEQRKEFDAKLANQKRDYDEKINAIKARQDECLNKIGHAQTDIKLLSQRYDDFKDTWHSKMQNVQFTVIKAVTVVGGAVLTYFKLGDYVELPVARFKDIKGNPLWQEFIRKDWFE